jgi:hypothetical protein
VSHAALAFEKTGFRLALVHAPVGKFYGAQALPNWLVLILGPK